MAKNTDLLDITDFVPKLGEDPLEAICLHIVKSVYETQAVIIQPLPNILLMTRTQFEIVKPDPDMLPFDQLLWKTKDPRKRDPDTGAYEIINMMDVHVKGEFEPKPSNLLLLS